jgi:pimeloyl-ACP methyl ester carboxylesterase
VAFVAILVMTSCSLNRPTSTQTPTPGQIAWSTCNKTYQCGTLQVPLDYSHPDAGTIGIALIRKPARDQTTRIGSVLTNPGGPGASGIQFLLDEAPLMTNLNRQFDLVGFDPRGIGQSAPVRCLSGPEEDAFNALDPVADDPQERQAMIQADQKFAAGCLERSARVLPFVDTVSATRDMDLIRASLGDAKLTYLGFSYGTFLGQVYAHLFPTHIRALALDGVVDPSLSANDLLLAQLGGFERNLQAFLANCNSRRFSAPPCAYAASGGDPATKLNALVSRLDRTPMHVGRRDLTRSLAITGVGLGLYNQSFWPTLDAALTSADKGDGRLLLRLSDVYLGRDANGTYTNELDANYAVNCLDKPVPADVAAFDRLAPAFAKVSTFFGPAFQYGNLPCSYWPVKPTGQVGPVTADGAPPILLIGGTNDPATPYAWAQAVHRQLAGSVLLTRRGNGHTSYDASICARLATDAYLIDLTLPAPGTICT